MTKRYVALFALVALLFTLGACKKKEETPITGAPHATSPSIMMPGGEAQVIVPDNVRDKWSAVIITVEDKMANTSEDVKIPLNSSYTIKGSNVRIAIGDFLPDFKMDAITITSLSNEPNNPAVRVIVYEGEEELWKGWLYSKFPAIHPFQHEKYGLLLREGIKKS